MNVFRYWQITNTGEREKIWEYHSPYWVNILSVDIHFEKTTGLNLKKEKNIVVTITQGELYD